MQSERKSMIEEFDMDYATIKERLTQEFPEFAEGA